MRTRFWLFVPLWMAAAASGAPLTAQQAVGADGVRALSLEEALRMAESQSEQVLMAEAGITRARGDQYRARSERFPQVGASFSYTRALASEFDGAFGGGAPDSTAGPPGPPCEPFIPNPALPLEQRVNRLEGQFTCDSSPFAGLDFSDLPFGRENTIRLGLSVSQNLFTGGRVRAQNEIAGSGRTVAEIGLESARAQLVLDVTQAYYDAVLSGRLVEIAEASLGQAETTLQQTQLARQVGNQSEFELLRAQVTRDNQRPLVIQRRADSDLANLRLKQILNLPADQPLTLTTDLGDAELVPVTRLAVETGGDAIVPIDEAEIGPRAPVRQALEAVEVQQSLLDVARSQRLPTISVNSQYGRVAYPVGGLPGWDDFRSNWTVGVSLQVPLFTGGRIRGDELVARANLTEAEARLQQVQELAELDSRTAYERLAAATATWLASTGTVDQAARAYQIADLRYREGISTQVELTDSRILLQQAQANRAMAARDLQIARVRVALLEDLPLGLGGAAGGQPAAQAGQQQAVPPQAPRQQATDASQTGFPGIGGQ